MNILWIGGVALPNETGELLYEINNPGPVAATNVQKSIIDGLEEQYDVRLNIVNDYPVDFYPRFSRLFLYKNNWQHKIGVDDTHVGFINIPILRNITKSYTMREAVKQWARQRIDNEQNQIIIYTVHTPYLIAARVAKTLLKNVNICLVCPDLPEYMDLELRSKPVKRILKRIDRLIMNYYLNFVDKFVMFTRYMDKPLNIGKRESIVMEGIFNHNNISYCTDVNKSDEKIVLYTGMTHRNYGIEELLIAFSLIKDPDIKLWITGDGSARDIIADATKNDSRIKWFGFLKDRNQVIKLQQQATLLVNMRRPSEKASRYCFPSKIIEYMMSSTPILSYKIDGIPDEYYEHMFVIEKQNPQYIASKIVEILNNNNNDELNNVGKRAKQFVLNNKNNLVQTRRIMELIK
jgi:glycosyltransferase involved in cell wall biosynthesis